jgi:hypothetical protein
MVLDQLAEVANVAQFVSFGPDLKQRYARVRRYPPNYGFESVYTALDALLKSAPDGSVNVRTFTPETKSREFIYGLRKADEVMTALGRLTGQGLYTIVNETIDVNDGGVSGVALGDVLEFAPGDTPRCVEKPGTVSLPRQMGLQLLQRVYHFHPSIDYGSAWRVEFSLHPLRRGFRHEHTIIWELEKIGRTDLRADIQWPNRFSRFIGDKAFGLLVADTLGLPVPTTTVISRTLAPFTFGRPTGTGEMWIRTCPVEQVPGRFTTQRGWRDPFKLLVDEDPDGTLLASVLAQEGVGSAYSGALVATPNGEPIIEGVRGRGDDFMQGRRAPEPIPDEVLGPVKQLYNRAATRLGPVRVEWVYDNQCAWIVQLHRGASPGTGRTIYPGEADFYHRFKVINGIEALRLLISKVQGTGEGIILVGEVGVTSHLGDLLRRAKIPSRIEPPNKA